MIDKQSNKIIGNVNIANGFAQAFEDVGREAFVANLVIPPEANASHSRVPTSERITISEILTACKKLKPKRSVGTDGLPAYIVKACIEPLMLPLLYTFLTEVLPVGFSLKSGRRAKLLSFIKKATFTTLAIIVV